MIFVWMAGFLVTFVGMLAQKRPVSLFSTTIYPVGLVWGAFDGTAVEFPGYYFLVVVMSIALILVGAIAVPLPINKKAKLLKELCECSK